MDISNLTHTEKVKLLKDLADDLDIVITACYGATDSMASSMISIAQEDVPAFMIRKGTTVLVQTEIMTG